MIRRVVKRVLRSRETEAELERSRRQLETAEARLEKVKANYARASRKLDDLLAQLEETRTRAARWKQEAGKHRRRRLSGTVARELLSARRGQLRFRASARDADDRDARMLAASPAYREALEQPGQLRPAEGTQIELDGLAWWVPTRTTHGPSIRRAAEREALPYLAVTQTREFSVGGVMLDLGAYNGGTAIPRVILGDVEACYCAEPDPANYACLVANVLSNGLRGFVLPDRVAIGNSDRTGRLLRTKASRGHRLVEGGDGETDIVTVSIRTLDRWVESLAVDPRAVSFIKSDTQGYELQVLQGAPRLLAQPHIAWQLEVSPRLLESAGTDPREFIALLQRHFTHYVDLNVDGPGRRRKDIGAVGGVFEYLVRDEREHTDIIVYSASGARDR